MDEHRDENMSAFGSTTYPNLSRVGEEDTILNSIENQEVSTGNTFEKPNCSDLILKGRTSTGDLKVRGGSLEKENYSSSSYSDTIMEDYSLYQENSFSSTTTAHPNLGNYKETEYFDRFDENNLPKFVCSLEDYTPQNEEDIGFEKGDIMLVEGRPTRNLLKGIVIKSSEFLYNVGTFPVSLIRPLEPKELLVFAYGKICSTESHRQEVPRTSKTPFPARFLGQNKLLQERWPEIIGRLEDANLDKKLEQLIKGYPPVDPSRETRIPVKFTTYESSLAGTIVYLTTNDPFQKYPFYKIHLHGIKELFQDKYFRWNKNYPSAHKIFAKTASAKVIRGVIRAAHASIFRCSFPEERCFSGEVRSLEDFLNLFHFGIRKFKPRIFTYVITDNYLFCTECGFEFYKDLISKHAVLSNAAENVRMAGEFFLYCSGGKLYFVIDNGSGTYSPDESAFSQLRELMSINFPFLQVVPLNYQDQDLHHYREKVLRFKLAI